MTMPVLKSTLVSAVPAENAAPKTAAVIPLACKAPPLTKQLVRLVHRIAAVTVPPLLITALTSSSGRQRAGDPKRRFHRPRASGPMPRI